VFLRACARARARAACCPAVCGGDAAVSARLAAELLRDTGLGWRRVDYSSDVYIHTYIHIYQICVCVCVCVCIILCIRDIHIKARKELQARAIERATATAEKLGNIANEARELTKGAKRNN
jgi:hypothetical protein